jgi:uncharacterized membrane protein YdjX (TVP38/TMEM64 family)
MPLPSLPLRRSLYWAELLPALRLGLWVVALFVVALLLSRSYAEPIQALLQAHSRLAILVFVATSVVAVLVPVLTNLPLVPLAVLAWGPTATASLLLTGWVLGAALSFTIARHARGLILHYFPSASRHADIDRLIHPRHRLVSLILLRMTFPVDVLSYALGLFSRRTTLRENALSTALGAAPFALLFAWIPTLTPSFQIAVLVSSTLVFVVYTAWVLRATPPPSQQAKARGDS